MNGMKTDVLKREAVEAQRRMNDDMRMRKEAEERREAERRDGVKEKMKRASVKGESFDPEAERNLKQKHKEDEERAAKEVLAEAERKKKDEKDRAEAKKKEVEDAKQLAAHFMG